MTGGVTAAAEPTQPRIAVQTTNRTQRNSINFIKGISALSACIGTLTASVAPRYGQVTPRLLSLGSRTQLSGSLLGVSATPSPWPPPNTSSPLGPGAGSIREALRRELRRANLAWVIIVSVIAALALGVVWKAG